MKTLRRGQKKPLVSICTPTYNRREYIPMLVDSINRQTYPRQCLEWVVVDDGEDSVVDLIEGVGFARYFRINEKMPLGQKRNFMNAQARGDILVYMDDDDYYPPARVAHAVNSLLKNPEVLVAGSSTMHIYFKKLKQIYQVGPYGKNHATAGTFAFRRELLRHTRYDEAAEFAEESQFLKGFSIPMVQLDPLKCILCFAHDNNTFDKSRLLDSPSVNGIQKSSLKAGDFIKNRQALSFYTQ